MPPLRACAIPRTAKGAHRSGILRPIECRRQVRSAAVAACGSRRAEPCPLDRRPPEMIALQITDALLAEQRRLFLGLDAFGDRAKAEFSGQAQQVPQDDPVLASGGEAADKG